MNTLRIFISSPSDVREERTVAGRVIERLQGKYWSFVRLDDVFWESRVARATAHFQDELLNPGQCDMVLGILWTRLGSPLPEKFRKLTGEAHATGTEWELSQAFEAYDASLAQTGDPLIAKPDVIVYRRTEEQAADPSDGEDRQQREALTAFLEREFFNQDTHHTIKRALTCYATLDEFETRLAGDLEQLILRRIPTLKPGFEPPPISGPPFKDLSHFDFEDSDRFFGRNRAIREVQQRLIERAAEGMPFVLIYGGSGYGKSSLMRAGLAPVLTRPGGALEGMDRWRRVLVQPGKGTGPLCERLARVLLASPTPHDLDQQKLHERWPLPGLPELSHTTIEPDDTGECWDAASLARLLADETKLLYAAAGVARTLDRLGHSLLLQIDQLEEIFTSESVTAAEHNAFCRAVAALTRTRRVWTVATMRSEYFPRIAETPALAALVGNSGGYILAPPTQQELREIIRFPALAARLDYERATLPREIAGTLTTAEHLDEQILADAADSPDALPLIEFTLHKLHAALLAPDGRRTGDLLRWDTYAALGGLKGSIARTAEETFSTLAPHVQGACDTLFANLVRVDAGSRDMVTRKRQALAHLRTAAPGAGDFLDAFLAARLLVTDEEASHAIVTLAHEALITHWPRLAEWIAHHRAILRSRQRLEENTRQWIESGRPKKLLLAEGRLAEAEEVAHSPLFRVTHEERELVSHSRNRARKRRWFFQAAVGTALAGVATFTTIWFGQEHRRRTELARSESAALTVAAEGHVERGSAGRALALLAEALRRDPENESAERRLYALLTQRSWPMPLGPAEPIPADEGNDAPPFDAPIASADGRFRLEQAGEKVELVDTTATPPRRTVLEGAQKPYGFDVTFSPDGSRLAAPLAPSQNATTASPRLGFWSTAEGRRYGRAIVPSYGIGDLRFSHDGSRFINAQGGYIQMWDGATGQSLASPVTLPFATDEIAISPDDSTLLVRTGDGRVRVFDCETLRQLAEPLPANVDARFAAEGRVVETRSWGPDAPGGRLRWSGFGERGPVRRFVHGDTLDSAVLSADGRLLATEGNDEHVRIWETATGLLRVSIRSGGGTNAIAFNADGRRVAAVISPLDLQSKPALRLWDAATGAPLGVPIEGKFRAPLFSPDGRQLLLPEDEGGVVRVLAAEDGKQIGQIVLSASPNGDDDLKYSPDGRFIFTREYDQATQEHRARLWDTTTLRAIGPVIADVSGVCFSPSGRWLLCTGKINRLLDLRTTEFSSRTLDPSMQITNLAISPDERLFVAGWPWPQLHDFSTSRAISDPCETAGTLSSLAFSPDSRRLLTVSDRTVQLWDTTTGERAGGPLLHASEVKSAVFTPDGRHVLTAAPDGAARLWAIDARAAAGKSRAAEIILARTLAEAASGYRTDARGVVRAVADRWPPVAELHRALEKPGAAELFWGDVARQLLRDPDSPAERRAERERTVAEIEQHAAAQTEEDRVRLFSALTDLLRALRVPEVGRDNFRYRLPEVSIDTSATDSDGTAARLPGGSASMQAAGAAMAAFPIGRATPASSGTPLRPGAKSEEPTVSARLFAATESIAITRAWELTSEEHADAERALRALAGVDLAALPLGQAAALRDDRARLQVAVALGRLLTPRDAPIAAVRYQLPTTEDKVETGMMTRLVEPTRLQITRRGAEVDMRHWVVIEFKPGLANAAGETRPYHLLRRQLRMSVRDLADALMTYYSTTDAHARATLDGGMISRLLRDRIAGELKIEPAGLLFLGASDHAVELLEGTLPPIVPARVRMMNPILRAANNAIGGGFLIDPERGRWLAIGGGLALAQTSPIEGR